MRRIDAKEVRNSMQTGRKIRLLPTAKQEALFWKSAGVARWAYNYFLEQQEHAYQAYLENGEYAIKISIKRNASNSWRKS